MRIVTLTLRFPDDYDSEPLLHTLEEHVVAIKGDLSEADAVPEDVRCPTLEFEWDGPKMDLGAEVVKLVELANHPATLERELDEAAKPLLEELRERGAITKWAHVEWQGAWEHGLIAVFWYKTDACIGNPDASPGCLNVNPDGTVDVFGNAQ